MSLKDPEHDPGVWWFSPSPGCWLGLFLWFRKCWYWVKMCPSLSANHDANQNSELNKNQKYPKVMSKVSLMCYWVLAGAVSVVSQVLVLG